MIRFRTFLGLIIATILVYTGLWYTQGMKAEKQVIAGLSGWRDQGLKVEHGKVALSGFPYRIMIEITNPDINTRSGAMQAHAASITLISHVWTPGHWLVEARDARLTGFGGKLHLSDGYMLASYRIHADGRPVIAISSNGTDDFILDKVPGLEGPVPLKDWQLALRPGIDADAAASGLYEKRFLDFNLRTDTGISKLDLTGGISGPVIKDWTTGILGTWRDEGGLVEIDSLDFVIEQARIKGDGNLTLDENFRPLGSLSLKVSGGPKAADYLSDLGIKAGGSLGQMGTGAETIAVMLQNGEAVIGSDEANALHPVVN